MNVCVYNLYVPLYACICLSVQMSACGIVDVSYYLW